MWYTWVFLYGKWVICRISNGISPFLTASATRLRAFSPPIPLLFFDFKRLRPFWKIFRGLSSKGESPNSENTLEKQNFSPQSIPRREILWNMTKKHRWALDVWIFGSSHEWSFGFDVSAFQRFSVSTFQRFTAKTNSQSPETRGRWQEAGGKTAPRARGSLRCRVQMWSYARS